MPTAIVPGIYDPALADENVTIETEIALRLIRRLAREEGLLVGPSSGAALAASIQLAETFESGVVVAIFPDGGERYLSDSFWTRPADEDASVRIIAPRGVIDAIRRHGEETFPDECCGALIGPRAGEVDEAFPIVNTTSLEKKRRFLVGPAEYRAAEARADARGAQLLGFYHSHPDHPAIPSAFDREHALPNLSYVIVSVRDGSAAEARSWRLRADRSGYDEERLDSGE